MRDLSAKEKKAVQAFVETGSKTEAYRTAYEPADAKPSSISRMATRVFARPHVRAELDRIQSEAREDNKLTVDWVLEEYRKKASFRITDAVYVVDGTIYITDTAELTDDQVACIKSFEETKDGVKVTFHDPQKALADIAKHLGMFSERHILEMGSTFGLTVNLDRYAAPMEPGEIVGDDVQGGSGPDE